MMTSEVGKQFNNCQLETHKDILSNSVSSGQQIQGWNLLRYYLLFLIYKEFGRKPFK
jgi:hypothetical protein